MELPACIFRRFLSLPALTLGILLYCPFAQSKSYVVSDECPNKPFDALSTCHLHPTDHAPGQSPGQWGPWGWEPVCFVPDNASVDLFCLVSSPDFNNKRGISIIGTKPAIGAILRDAVMNHTVAGLARRHLSLELDDAGGELAYEVTALPDKDIGVVARRTIRRGESFMVSLPAVVVDHEFQMIVGEDELAQELYRRAADQLADGKRVLGLARSMGGDALSDVLNTNAHTAVVHGRPVTALYPEVARLNHNCDPNAVVRFSPGTLGMQVLALRDITKGEEIEISYIDDGLVTSERKRQLSHAFGFNCLCSMCTASEEEIEKSDRNRERILEIWNIIKEDQDMQYDAVFKITNELIQLCDKEHLGPGVMKRYFHDLMKLYFEYGDVASSTMFAESALELSETFDGEDDLDGLQPALRGNLKALQLYFEEMAKAVSEGSKEEEEEEGDKHEHHHHDRDHDHLHHGHGHEHHDHDHHHHHHHH